MTREQVLAAAEAYEKRFEDLGVKPLRHPTNGVLPTGMGALGHAAWMCQHIRTVFFADLTAKDNVEKAMRWLGFIQGILWMTGQASIDMMKNDNRSSTC